MKFKDYFWLHSKPILFCSSYTKAPFFKKHVLAEKRYSKFESVVEHNVLFINTHQLFQIMHY